MSQLIRAIAIVAIACAVARAGSSARVVLVDPDPELRRAVTTALAPWKLEVIADPDPQFDAASAAARADAKSARFVVWREGGELVVFDRDSGESLRREGRTGTLDPIEAASAALTVKTLMRLPPPGEVEAVAPRGLHTEIRVQGGLATRIAHGSDSDVAERFVGAVMVKPRGDLELRAGLIGDTGAARQLDRANFKGTWDDWSLVAVASWTVTRKRLEIEPFAGLGLERSTFRGVDNNGMGSASRRDEGETLAMFRAGVWARARFGIWTVGAGLGVDAVAGTPTYTKVKSNSAIIYAVPSSAVSLGFFLGADLGR